MENLTIDGRDFLIDSEVKRYIKVLKIKRLESILKYYELIETYSNYVYGYLSKSNKGYDDWKRQLKSIRDNYRQRYDKLKG